MSGSFYQMKEKSALEEDTGNSSLLVESQSKKNTESENALQKDMARQSDNLEKRLEERKRKRTLGKHFSSRKLHTRVRKLQTGKFL